LSAQGGIARGRSRRSRHVELKDAADDNASLRTVPILSPHEAKRLGPVDEQTAADSALVLHNPVAVAILADHEE
jgi:hypothetical protein